MAVLQSAFCGLFPLKTGTMIIGIIYMVMCMIELLTDIAGLVFVEMIVSNLYYCKAVPETLKDYTSMQQSDIQSEEISMIDNDPMSTANTNSLSSTFLDENPNITATSDDNTLYFQFIFYRIKAIQCNMNKQQIEKIAYGALILAILLSLYMIVASVLLVKGAQENLHSHLKPWIMGVTLLLLMSVISLIMIIVMGIIKTDGPKKYLIITLGVIFIGWIFIHCYLLLVVISCYQDMERARTESLDSKPSKIVSV